MDNRNKPEQEWERDLLERLASDALVERRRARRWGIFFKSLAFLYMLVFVLALLPADWLEQAGGTKEHVALVEFDGIIASGEKASADRLVGGLRDAFKDANTKAVILRINSPGGSPVQSSDVYKEIKRLREKHTEIPLYAVVTDMCASGGYYVASAADRIFVNESSIIGSIGVLMNGFGFVDAIDRLGVERRLLTAGEHKGILDPFTPLDEFQKDHVEKLLEGLHQTFIDAVKAGRGDRLKASDAELFGGLFWSGEEGIRLGLADEIGSAGQVAREIVGVERLVDFTRKDDALDRLARRLGAAVGSSIGGLGGMMQLR